jgi:hypothetical protein
MFLQLSEKRSPPTERRDNERVARHGRKISSPETGVGQARTFFLVHFHSSIARKSRERSDARIEKQA